MNEQKHNNHNKIINQYGGSKLGSGGYVCAIIPAFKCTKNQNIKGKISKIIPQKHIKNINSFVNTKIKKIDPTQEMFIFYDKYCPLRMSTINKRKHKDITIQKKNIANADNPLNSIVNDFTCIINPKEKYYNIIENYGGITLHTILNEKQNIIDLNFVNTMIKQLLYSIKKLHDNKIIHKDIKIDNILYKNNKFRLIDFNVSISTHKYDNNFIFSGNLNYNIPIDYLILYYICYFDKMTSKEFNDKLISTITKKVIEKHKTHYNSLSHISKSISSKFLNMIKTDNIIIKNETKNNFNFKIKKNTKTKKNTKIKKNTKTKKKIKTKIHNKLSNNYDKIEQLKFKNVKKLVKLMLKIYKRKNFYDYYYTDYLYNVDIYGLGITFGIFIDFISKLKNYKSNNKLKSYYKLVNNMTNFNPILRYDINKCIAYCDKHIF